MKSLEEQIGDLLRDTGLTLSAAESCTGGNISHLITTVPGASTYYLGSVTSYAVPIKNKVLGVPLSVVEEKGVVSSEVAAAMAEGVRELTSSTFSVATTGLAGPGGDGHHPEGTVWIAVAGPDGTKTEIFNSNAGRKGNIDLFTAEALTFLIKYIRNFITNSK